MWVAGTATHRTDSGGSPVDGYAPPERRPPLLAYGVLSAVFGSLVAAAILALRRSGRELPDRIGAGDFALVAVASHKASRLLAKEKVASFIRAPFTELRGKGGPAELEEAPRGGGARRAIGELLVCPYCLGMWIATGFALGIAVAPRLTRFVATVLSAVTVSDFLQIAYKAAEEKGLEG